jgi:hypothetical protein
MELEPKGPNDNGEYEYKIKLEAVVKFPPSRKVEFAVLPADTPEPQASMYPANLGTGPLATQFSEGGTGGETIELYAMIEVADKETLALISADNELYKLNEKYKQTADIYISGTWTSIGTKTNPFTGSFDGSDKMIIPNNVTGEDYLGIFGYAEGAIFKNIHIDEGTITTAATKGYLGGIAGYAGNTKFSNCSNAANITSTINTAGICGYLEEESYITGCWNTGNITGGASAGGICSYAITNSCIENSFNTGNITASLTANGAVGVGGIIDGCSSGVQVIACYNTGDVIGRTTGTGALYVGGICGNPGGNATSSGHITACYNTGNVSSDSARDTGRKTYIGGISGYNSRGGVTITASYSTGTVSYSENNKGTVYIGGISGYSTWSTNDEVKSPVITACYWTAVGDAEHGIGIKKIDKDEACSDEGTAKFSDSWPTNGTHDDWGTKYWKSISNGSYPKLAWEKN